MENIIIPIRVLQFRDLPEIPECKRYIGGKHTPEMKTHFSYFQNMVISKEEEKILRCANNFYNSVIPLFKKLDFNTFSKEDFEKFKNYFIYVFNYTFIVGNDLECPIVYRIVKNYDVLKEHKSIPHIDFLKYPPIHKVKEFGKYNRASTPDFTMFYGSGSVNTALLELRPQKDELITLGIWQNKNPGKKLIVFPVDFGKTARFINQGVNHGYKHFQKEMKKQHPLIKQTLEIISGFLGDEYSKPVTNHLDYFISAIFSERILKDRDIMYRKAILYPSVQHKYRGENLAIRPDVIDNEFQLAKVYEISPEETFYNLDLVETEPSVFTYIKPKYIKESKPILPDGKIEW